MGGADEAGEVEWSAGLQPAYDSHHVCGIQLKEKINLGVNVQSRSQTGAPVAFMERGRPRPLQRFGLGGTQAQQPFHGSIRFRRRAGQARQHFR